MWIIIPVYPGIKYIICTFSCEVCAQFLVVIFTVCALNFAVHTFCDFLVGLLLLGFFQRTKYLTNLIDYADTVRTLSISSQIYFYFHQNFGYYKTCWSEYCVCMCARA